MRPALLIGVLVVFMESPASAEEADTVTTRFILRMPQHTLTPAQAIDTLDLTMHAIGRDIAGFNLKFGLFHEAVTIIDVLEGETLDSCHWSLLDVRPAASDGDADNSERPELWQAVGLARFITDSTEPVCLGLPREAGLVRLVVACDWSLVDSATDVPLLFFWEECKDNTLSDETGALTFMSKNVFDYSGSAVRAVESVFPSTTGTPKQCIKLSAPSKPRRALELHHGVIRLMPEPAVKKKSEEEPNKKP